MTKVWNSEVRLRVPGTLLASSLKKAQKPVRWRRFEAELFACDRMFESQDIGMQAGSTKGIVL